MGGIKKKIKILYTIPNFSTAGSGKVLCDLARRLNSERFEVSIACNHDKGAFFDQVKAIGLPVYLVESTVPLRPYYNLFIRLKPFRDFIKAHKFDIVHSWHWSSDWTEALSVRLLGVKWLYTKKAMGFQGIHWKIRSYLASFIVTINPEMQEYFPKRKQQKLIPIGIDTNYYNYEKFYDKSRIEPTDFYIIMVANLVPVKGMQILIEAVHKLNDSSVKLTILGEYENEYGEAMVALKNSLNMQEQVRFFGKVLDVRPEIIFADLYVIPTLDEGRKEGMPMALVEAMSMGTPVLGSDIEGINFVLKDYKNLLFPAGDSNALGQKIREMRQLTVSEREKLGSNLRSYCIEHFSMKDFIKAHEQLYDKLLHKR